MKFFKKVRWKFAVKKIIPMAAILLIAAALTAFGIYLLGDSSKTRISARDHESIGITVPTPVLGVVFIIGGIIGAGVTIHFGHKELTGNSEYLSLIKSVKKIGNVNEIGNILESLPKSKLTKNCELRINDELLYLRDSSQAIVIPLNNIISTEMDTDADPKKGTIFFVRVVYGEEYQSAIVANSHKAFKSSIRIISTKNNYYELYKDITARVAKIDRPATDAE